MFNETNATEFSAAKMVFGSQRLDLDEESMSSLCNFS